MVEELLKAGVPVHFSKGNFPIQVGQQLDSVYYITKGLVRGFYLDADGNEVTKCFSAENELFGVEGFLYHRDATFFVECLEDVDAIRASYDTVRQWMAEDIAHTTYINNILIQYNQATEERNKNLLMEDASARYQHFLVDYANIEKRLKQRYIASYLGINAVSLSRLKKTKS